MSNLLNFKHGFQANLKENSPAIVPGTVYVTRDERALYVDLPPYDHGNGNIEAAKRVRIGDMRTYEYLSQLQEDLKNDMSNLTMSALYYAQKDNPTDNKVINALLKWDGSAFIQLNKTSDLTASLDTLEGVVNGHTTLIENNASDIKDLQDEIEKLEGADTVSGSIANSIKAAKEELIGVINTKANQSDLNTLSQTVSDNKSAVDTSLESLTGRVGTNEINISNLQQDLSNLKGTGVGSVSEQIATAVNAEKQAREAKDTEHTNAISQLNTGLSNEITARESLAENVSNNYAKKTDVETTYAKKADVEATYATKTELNTAKADLLGDATNPSAETIRGVKKAVEAKQTLIESAQSTADGAVSALNTYKNQNDAALDVVRNTANAAATNVDLQAEIKRSTEADTKYAQDLLAETTAREALGGRVDILELFFESADNSAEAIDKLKEIQDYIASDKTGAATMAGNIQANTQAIETKASKDELAAEASTRESAVENAITTAQEYTDTVLAWGQF